MVGEHGNRTVGSEIKVANSRFNKDQWKTNEVRALLSNPPDLKQEPCYICGEHKDITVLHHVVPVSVLADYLNGGWISASEVSSPIVWLCPNCHRYVHEWMDGNSDAVLSVPMFHYDSLLRYRLSSVLVACYSSEVEMIEVQLERMRKAIAENDTEIERLESEMKERSLG